MSNKEKVDIKRSDQFQEMDEALTQAMAELDSTIDRVSAIFGAADQEIQPQILDAPADEEDLQTAATGSVAADTADEAGE